MARPTTNRERRWEPGSQVAALQADGPGASWRPSSSELTGKATRTHDLKNLRKRIAWHLQNPGQGGLSQRALDRHRAAGAARTAPLERPTGEVEPPAKPARDPRLPPAGTVITKLHGGREHRVIVREADFEYEGERYRSLSAVARRSREGRLERPAVLRPGPPPVEGQEGGGGMSEIQFFQTAMGQRFFESTMPELVRQLARLNELLAEVVKRLDRGRETETTTDSEDGQR